MADAEYQAVTASVPSLQLVDLVRAGSWNTAFFTTYSLSLSYFEAVVLSRLFNAGSPPEPSPICNSV
jgi:hypothetical protein